MKALRRVAVFFGGRSGEHEVSLRSAESVVRAMNRGKYEVLLVGISKEGKWLLQSGDEVPVGGIRGGTPVAAYGEEGKGVLMPLDRGGPAVGFDVAFPIMHGTYGEDGTIQGLFELFNIPYVGAGVLASALGMDKGLMKDVFRQKGLPVVDYLVYKRREWEEDSTRIMREIEETLGFPCFVKPANLGSSVGISKAKDEQGLRVAMNVAARYDRRIVVEKGVDARELECSVLGNDEPIASVPGEIIPSREFYDYEAKYMDDRSQLLIPAPVDPAVADQVRDLAKRAFLAIDCAGMARVDFFLEKGTGRLFVNEVNTIPGFTSISMYPKLWAATGLSYDSLIDRLIELAFERWRDKNRSITFYI